ncbi:MAG: T9SS type A sorting domain-containing protein, partial [Saprospiraceae bacterium]|nr:T9SS type A sorting domain-containing protein [Saprospiraceae bacterium]
NNKRFAVWYNKVGQPMGAGTLSSTVNVDIYDIRLDDTYKLWTACDYTGNLFWNGTALGTPGSGSGNNLIAILEPNVAVASPKIEYSGSSFPVNSIALGPDGQWFMGGYISNQVTIPGAGNFTSQGCSDVLVSSGQGLTVDWARTVGGSGCERLNNNYGGTLMGTDADGNLYLCGKFTNGADFDDNTFTGNGLWVGKLASGSVAVHANLSMENKLKAYPNPAGNSMVLDMPENSSSSDIVRIYAATGSLVNETFAEGSAITFDTEQWSPGTYFLVYTHAKTGMVSTGKVVVQH